MVDVFMVADLILFFISLLSTIGLFDATSRKSKSYRLVVLSSTFLVVGMTMFSYLSGFAWKDIKRSWGYDEDEIKIDKIQKSLSVIIPDARKIYFNAINSEIELPDNIWLLGKFTIIDIRTNSIAKEVEIFHKDKVARSVSELDYVIVVEANKKNLGKWARATPSGVVKPFTTEEMFRMEYKLLIIAWRNKQPTAKVFLNSPMENKWGVEGDSLWGGKVKKTVVKWIEAHSD